MTQMAAVVGASQEPYLKTTHLRLGLWHHPKCPQHHPFRRVCNSHITSIVLEGRAHFLCFSRQHKAPIGLVGASSDKRLHLRCAHSLSRKELGNLIHLHFQGYALETCWAPESQLIGSWVSRQQNGRLPGLFAIWILWLKAKVHLVCTLVMRPCSDEALQ